ncbi:ferritin-like domain-containing protein [Actinosynnema sp. NPDC053489]|uniref:ferritin-like domain-containing protein n=1 Tax=Actinosynnema sp. NPDC053489 TaxID=3363916 RepID=UPI0037C98697
MSQSVATRTTMPPRPAKLRDTDVAAVRAIAQAAVNVELFTIPLYLTAMTSIQGMHQITGKDQDFYRGRLWPGPATTADPKTPNEKAYNLIFSVFVEEMLHVQMAANLASRIGVVPTFTGPPLQNANSGWTCYGPDKTVIPHIVDLTDTTHPKTVKVDLGPVDDGRVALFRAIEASEEVAKEAIKPNARHKYFPIAPFDTWRPGGELPMFGTIGHLYRCYYDYLNLRYDDNPDEPLWHYAYDCGLAQRDLFNSVTESHPKREFRGFDTTITRPSLRMVWDLLSAIADHGEGSELPRDRPRAVDERYQADRGALERNYPRYTDTGEPTASADAAARHGNGVMDHHERFTELDGLRKQAGFTTWPDWRPTEPKPWTAEDLVTKDWRENTHDLPSPEDVAQAMNDLGVDDGMYRTISQAAVGSIAGVTRVLDEFWSNAEAEFPYPSMVGSGDRTAICWALFRRAPDLSAGPEGTGDGTLKHACQALDLRDPAGNDCATADVFHSCRGSNACRAEGGCGFVQPVEGGGGCGSVLVKAKITGSTADGEDTRYSAPGDNRCRTFGGCAVPISASQILPRGGTMQLFDFVEPGDTPEPFDTMTFERGETVHQAAYRAYRAVMAHRGKLVPEFPPPPNGLRLAFPPST